MPIRSLALGALLAASLTSCDSASGYEIGGIYEGVTERGGAVATILVLRLPTTDSGTSFTFSGMVIEIETDGGTTTSEREFASVGTYDHPDLTLTIEGEPTTGTVSEDGDILYLTTEAGEEPDRLVRAGLD